MNARHFTILICSWLIIIILGFFSSRYIKIDTDLFASFNQNQGQFSTAELKYLSKIKSQIFILVRGDNLEESTKLALSTMAEFSDGSLITNLNILGIEKYKKLYDYYLKHTPLILSKDYKKKINNKQFYSLAEGVLKRLYGPFLVDFNNFAADPLFIVENFFVSHRSPFSLETDGNYFMTRNDTRYRILEGTVLDEKLSLKKLTNLKNTFNETDFYFFSTAFYEAMAKETAILESNVLGIISFIFIVVIFTMFGRGPKDIITMITSLCLTLVLSFCIYALFWKKMSIMTPILAISILGVLVDYFIHLLNHASSKKFLSRLDLFSHLKQPVFWSALTSFVGYIFFFFSPLPVLKEFSLLALISLPIAMIIMYFYLPLLILAQVSVEAKPNRFFNEIFWNKFLSKKVQTMLVFLGVLFIVLISHFGHIKNDLRSFANPSQDLLKQEKAIMSLLAVNKAPALILVKGKTIQEILENEENFIQINSLTQFSALSSWLPSYKEQKVSLELYPRLKHATDLLGQFLKKSIALPTDKKKSADNFIQPDDWLSEFKDFPPSQLWIGLISDHYYSIIQCFDCEKSKLIFNDSIRMLDRTNDIGFHLDRYSGYVLMAIGAIVIIIFVVFGLKFDFSSAFWIIFPSCFAILCALAVLLVVNLDMNLFHCLGAILVLVLGLDYSFFYFFKTKNIRYPIINSTASKSVAMSSLTTMASFGVLLLSSTLAVKSFGGVVFVGVLCCWFLCPLSENKRNNV